MLLKSTQSKHDVFGMRVQYSKDIDITFSSIFDFLRSNSNLKKIVFIDPMVLANHDLFLEIELCDPMILLVPTNLHESNKDITSLVPILDVLEANGTGRRGDIICAIGGGALLDIVAFAASIFRRGIAVVKVPTTLLGIVDASIGIKTGINFSGQRNRLGSYHFDFKVIIDPTLMKGLHSTLLRQGLGEVLKIATIKSKELFDSINSHKHLLEKVDFYQTDVGISILALSINLMLEELHDNPREDNLMRCVDYGHSFSPLVEMESLKRSGAKSIPHGFAVAYDCMLSAVISKQRGLLTNNDFDDICSLFLSFDFNFNNEIYLDHNLLWSSFMEMTKHRGNNQNLPIPISIGSFSFIQDLTYEEMVRASSYLKECVNNKTRQLEY